MKVTRATPPQPFVPVVITLETQDEVDMLHAWSNHCAVSHGQNTPLGDLHQRIRPFIGANNAHRFYSELDQRIARYEG